MFSFCSFLKWNFDLNRIYFFICHWNALRNSVCIFSTSFGLMQEKRIINFITKSPKIVCFSYLLTSYLCRALCQSFKNKLTHKISFSWQSDLCDVWKKIVLSTTDRTILPNLLICLLVCFLRNLVSFFWSVVLKTRFELLHAIPILILTFRKPWHRNSSRYNLKYSVIF